MIVFILTLNNNYFDYTYIYRVAFIHNKILNYQTNKMSFRDSLLPFFSTF